MGLPTLSRSVIDFYEGYVVENNKIPSLSEVLEEIPSLNGSEENLLKTLNTKEVREALELRGIAPFAKAAQASPRGISPIQLAALSLAFDFHDHRPLASKLKQLNLTTRQWNGWLRSNGRFAALVRRRSEAAFQELLPTAQSGLARSLEAGNPATLRLYYEMLGYSQPQNTIDAQSAALIQSFLERVIEIVTQKVSSPEERKEIVAALVPSSGSSSDPDN